MALGPGDVVFLDYGERPVCIHTRVVLAVVDHGTHEYVVLTPDFDVYTEVLHQSNPDLTRFWLAGPRGAIPRGVSARNVYSFAPMSPAELSGYMQRGRQEAEDELIRRGGGVGLGVAAAAAAPTDGGVGGGGAERKWVLAESVAGHKIGEEISLAAGAATDGDRALHRLVDSSGGIKIVLVAHVTEGELEAFCEERIQACREAEASFGDDRSAGDDARTLSLKYGPNGERSRGFKESVQEMRTVEQDDFPFSPRTCADYLKAVTHVAESCLAQHTMWVSQSGIPSGDRAVYEDDCLSRVLDMAIKFDGLNVTNLACFELIVRRKQLIAEAHSYAPGAPSYEAADHFMQTGFRPGGAIVVPSLTKAVSEKLHQEGQILKERRKLREEKGNKGRGRGSNQPGGKDQPGGGPK